VTTPLQKNSHSSLGSAIYRRQCGGGCSAVLRVRPSILSATPPQKPSKQRSTEVGDEFAGSSSAALADQQPSPLDFGGEAPRSHRVRPSIVASPPPENWGEILKQPSAALGSVKIAPSLTGRRFTSTSSAALDAGWETPRDLEAAPRLGGCCSRVFECGPRYRRRIPP